MPYAQVERYIIDLEEKKIILRITASKFWYDRESEILWCRDDIGILKQYDCKRRNWHEKSLNRVYCFCYPYSYEGANIYFIDKETMTRQKIATVGIFEKVEMLKSGYCIISSRSYIKVITPEKETFKIPNKFFGFKRFENFGDNHVLISRNSTSDTGFLVNFRDRSAERYVISQPNLVGIENNFLLYKFPTYIEVKTLEDVSVNRYPITGVPRLEKPDIAHDIVVNYPNVDIRSFAIEELSPPLVK